MPADDARTARTRLRRVAERAVNDRSRLDEILDEELICHVGFVIDGEPRVIPTLHARLGDDLFLHGSPAAGFLRAAKTGQMLCVTVTIIDGLVLARSAFHHSANYRSAVVFGAGHRVDEDAKATALDAFVDKLTPGRRETLRAMTSKEVRQTEIVSIRLTEWSVKERSGPPGDDDDDYRLPIWAGVIPIRRTFGEPDADPRLHPDATVPSHLGFFRS